MSTLETTKQTSTDIELNDLLKRTGLDRRTLTFYRDLGLIPRPQKTGRDDNKKGSRSLYPVDTIEVLDKIGELKKRGKTLQEIKEVLASDRGIRLSEKDLRGIEVKAAFGGAVAVEGLLKKAEALVGKKYPGRSLHSWKIAYETVNAVGKHPFYKVKLVEAVVK